MVGIAVAHVRLHFYRLDQRRVFGGHGAGEFLIAWVKLHGYTNQGTQLFPTETWGKNKLGHLTAYVRRAVVELDL